MLREAEWFGNALGSKGASSLAFEKDLDSETVLSLALEEDLVTKGALLLTLVRDFVSKGLLSFTLEKDFVSTEVLSLTLEKDFVCEGALSLTLEQESLSISIMGELTGRDLLADGWQETMSTLLLRLFEDGETPTEESSSPSSDSTSKHRSTGLKLFLRTAAVFEAAFALRGRAFLLRTLERCFADLERRFGLAFTAF